MCIGVGVLARHSGAGARDPAIILCCFTGEFGAQCTANIAPRACADITCNNSTPSPWQRCRSIGSTAAGSVSPVKHGTGVPEFGFYMEKNHFNGLDIN